MWHLVVAGTLAVMQGNKVRMQDRAGNVLGTARAQAANTIREGKNEERAAQGSLARFMQSENNKRRMNAAGEVFNSAQEELYRTNDFNVDSSVERQLASAEVAGALAANSAFAGAAGGSSDVLALTTSLKAARQRRLQEKREKQITYEQVKQITGIMPQAVASLDMTSFNDGMDRSEDWNQYIDKSTTSWAGDFLKGAAMAYVSGGGGNPSVATGSEAVMGANMGPQLSGVIGPTSYGALDSLRDWGINLGRQSAAAFRPLQL